MLTRSPVLEAYRNSGLQIKLLGPSSLTETADLSKMGGLPNNVYTAMYYAADLDNEGNRRFAPPATSRITVRSPDGYAMAAYDSASVLFKALRLVDREPTPAALNKALGQLGRIESPRGVDLQHRPWDPATLAICASCALDSLVPANLLDKDLRSSADPLVARERHMQQCFRLSGTAAKAPYREADRDAVHSTRRHAGPAPRPTPRLGFGRSAGHGAEVESAVSPLEFG